MISLFEPPTETDGPIILTGEYRRYASARIISMHYTHSVPSGKSLYVQFGDAVVILSIPANKNIGRFLLGRDVKVWELSRLWAPDGHERNLLTRAISAAIKIIKLVERPEILVSYADPNAGHSGGVYRAASWVYHGQSEESRAYRGPAGEIVARRKFHSGSSCLTKREIEAKGFIQLKLPGKYRFVHPISRRARRAIYGESSI